MLAIVPPPFLARTGAKARIIICARRRVSKVPQAAISQRLQDLKHLQRPPVRLARAGGNRADAIHPVVLLRAGLEVRRGTEIIRGWVDILAAIEAINDLPWAMAKPPPVHMDVLLVVSLERDTHLDVQNVVA